MNGTAERTFGYTGFALVACVSSLGRRIGCSILPGFEVDSAQQVISEVGVQASTFFPAAQLTSWVGTCPGKG